MTMKKIAALFLMIVLLAGCAAAEGLVYTTASVTDSLNTQERFNAFYESGSFAVPIPGLKEGLIPQGVTYLPRQDWVVVAGYRDDGQNSALIALDNQTGEIVKEVHLNNVDGSAYTGHAGGVCATEKNLFISNAGKLFRLSLETFLNLPESSECAFEEEIDVPCRASYCSYADGMLWVGEFQYGTEYKTDRSHRVKSKDGTYRAWCCGYELEETQSEVGAVPDVILATDERIQGMTVRDGLIYLSQSYGRRNASVIHRFQNVLEMEHHQTAELNGVQVPVWCLDSRSADGMLIAPPMSECLCTVGDAVYVLFESGANKYMDPKKPSVNPVDEVFALTAF